MLYKALVSVSVTTVPFLLNYFLENRFKKRKKLQKKKWNTEQEHYYYHCIFLTMSQFDCRQHVFDKVACGEKCSFACMQTLVNFIASAQTSISMCMYILTLRQIENALIAARKRGVDVRIITDARMFKMKRCSFNNLKYKFGFSVKMQKAENAFMHHKYCLIDEKTEGSAKMVMGSLNYTLQGFAANFDLLVFTNDQNIIKAYSDDFEMLWQDFISNPVLASIK